MKGVMTIDLYDRSMRDTTRVISFHNFEVKRSTIHHNKVLKLLIEGKVLCVVLDSKVR